MGKLLVIVELLVKVKIINKYLGSDYVVKLSVGYIWDLLKSGLEEKIEWVKLIFIKGMSVEEKVKVKVEKECNVLVKCMGIDFYYGWKVNY